MNKSIRLILAAASITAGSAAFASTLSFDTASDTSFTDYFSVTPTVDNKLILNVSAGPTQIKSLSFDILGGPLNVAGVLNSNGNLVASFNDRTNNSYSLNAVQTYTLKVTGITNLLPSGVNGSVSIQYLSGNVVAAVPEPETYAMMLAGLGVMGFMVRRRNRTSASGNPQVC
jgi:hypothetical protein